MERGSLRVRLIVVWAVFIILTLQVAAVGLAIMFERSIMRRTVSELGLDLSEIAKGLVIDQNGILMLTRRPSDPQFGTPYSGRYWQVSTAGRAVLRSPSLWEFTIADAPRPAARDTDVVSRLEGPDKQRLIAVVRTVEVPDAGKPMPLQVMTAVTYSEIIEDTKKFSSDLLMGLAGIAVTLLLAAWAHVSVGLKPLKALSDKVAAVRSGSAARLDGSFPDEVMPLVMETNALIEGQEEALTAARARAADLAHGLKTPLAVLATQSRQLRKVGQRVIAEQLDQQIERMRCHIERELVRTRARGPSKNRYGRIDAREAIREIAGALQLLPRGREVKWQIEMPTLLMVPLDRADLNDIIGNLVDNALKWARGQLRITGRLEGGAVIMTVEDDGPGIAAEEIPRLLNRGERADLDDVPGSGLGLAIVRDLIEIYGGRLELSRSDLGGLRSLVSLPAKV